jgi:hypothetical protein
MKIFSLSHLIELGALLPDPATVEHAEAGYNGVIRLPIRDWSAVRDADHPEREFETHEDGFVEFELLPWKDTKGASALRWVLRGLVAI